MAESERRCPLCSEQRNQQSPDQAQGPQQSPIPLNILDVTLVTNSGLGNHRVKTNITIGGLSPFPGKETLPHTEFPLYCRTLPSVPSGASPLKMEKGCFKPNPKATPMHEQYQPVGFSQKTTLSNL